MPTCQCGTKLPGRRRKCDDCKKRPGKSTAAAAETPPPPPVPEGLRDRGLTLWRGIGQHLDTPAGQLALEACRLADRLDEFESAIAGKGVLNLMQLQLHLDIGALLGGDDVERVEVTVHIDKLLTEARQQSVAFAGILDKLAGLEVKSAKPAAPSGNPAPPPASNPLDELGQRRQQRGAQA
jgi:hypothetical protein